MLKAHTETEYHLTPQGWLKGSSWVWGAKIYLPFPGEDFGNRIQSISAMFQLGLPLFDSMANDARPRIPLAVLARPRLARPDQLCCSR
jgi:hypothetical protein